MQMTLTRTVVMLALAVAAGCSQSEEKPTSVNDDLTGSATGIADSHNSHNSLNWPGRYNGVFPCRDCDGVEITITLRSDGSFSRDLYHIGEPTPPRTESGQFNWHQDGRRISLILAEGDAQYFQVGENVLFAIDNEGNRIGGDDATWYRLDKLVNDPRVEDQTWFLVELRGHPVDIPESNQLPFLTLNSAEWQVKGNASCNGFFGSYVLRPGNRITFSRRMGATAMVCPDMHLKDAFLDVLRQTDNYSISEGMLSLNRARMAPLARFSSSVSGP